MGLLAINILIASVGIAITIVGAYRYYRKIGDEDNNENLIGIGIISIVLVGFIGFGVIGTESTDMRVRKEVKTAEVLKTETSVYIEISDNCYARSQNHKQYEEINDSTTFIYYVEYNMYGVAIDSSEVYYINKLGQEEKVE